MDEEQKRKFEVWWREFDKTRMLEMYAPRTIAQKAWEACLEANEVEEQEPEPTPTEMVKRLLEKGWEITFGGGRGKNDPCIHESNLGVLYSMEQQELKIAYRKAFPRKKRVEVEVWRHKYGTVTTAKSIGDEYGNQQASTDLSTHGWTKGIATFWVEDSDET